jgi:PKD repeat protein
MKKGIDQFRKSYNYILFQLLAASFLVPMFSLYAFAFDNPVMLNLGYANSIGKPIIRTSSGRIYYFIGDAGHTGQWDGWIEAHTSLNGSSWSQVSAEDQWRSSTDFWVAVDSQNVVHMVAFDWTYHPVYKKFNTADSPKADHSWEGYEMMESRSNSPYDVRCAIAIDGNDVPHVIYPSTGTLKGNKSYATLIYANKVGGTWHKTDIRPIANISITGKLDIVIGPDNVPYIQSGTKMLKGNANNPSAFETIDLGMGIYSFVIHQNGDVRVSSSSNGNYANYFHNHTQQWNSGWNLQVSNTPDKGGVLILVKDVPYIVKTLDEGIAVQKNFDTPVLVASRPLSGQYGYGDTVSRWSFFNNNSPGIIDIGFQSYINMVTSYFWYTKYRAAADASFLATPTFGYGPLAVSFSDTSTATEGKTITSWAWDFNNDGIIDSTLQYPSAVFTDVGKYTVTLTATDSGGATDTEIKRDYIEVKAGVDTDSDGIPDDLDNCPTVYNPKQTDLNGNGTGDACESSLDMFNQSLFSTGLRKEAASEKNSQNVTELMKDGLLTQGVRVQKSNQFDVVSFRSNVEAGKLSNFILYVYVNNIYGGVSQPIRIYPYNADGLTVQNTAINGYINFGWNNIDLTPILHVMNGMGFVKFRVVAVQNWFDISEAYLSELVDSWEISANPLNLDFGSLEVGKTSSQNLTISNTGYGELIIKTIKGPFSPFSVVTNGCSGKVLSSFYACTATVKFTPAAKGTFNDSLLVLSNDADHPSFKIDISGTAAPATAAITGTAKDYSTDIPLSNVAVTITDSAGGHSTLTDSNGKYTVTDLVVGSYTSTFSKTGYITQTVSGTISSGQTLTLNVQLVPYPPITISITSPQDGAVLNSSPITVTGATSNNSNVTINGIQASVNGNTFSASVPLNEGQNTITASATDQYGQTAFRTIQVTLSTKGSITGTVTDSSTGLPIQTAVVSVTDSLNNNRTTLTAISGNYIITSVEAGPFSESITKDGYAPYNFSGTIAAGQTVTVGAALNPILPVISNVASGNFALDSATITWTTEQPSDSLVEYGATISYGSSAKDATLVTNHSITLINLTSGTIYHFKVTSKNIYGISSSSVDNTFTTAKFQATTLGDYGNMTVMEVKGNYDGKNPDGSVNAVPREEIAKEFLRNHSDQYDFMVIFSNFDFTMPDAAAKAFYLEIKNDTQGIGKTIFDSSSLFGSNGKLQGTIDMGNMAKIISNPVDPKFEDTLATLAHEQMHRWGTYVKFKDAGGANSAALLGKDGTHWSYLLDSDASVMYGNDWQDNKDGTFTSTGKEKYYSPLDLYLMGIYDKSQVPPMLLIDNSAIDPARLPVVGTTITGAAKYVSINDIIAAEDQRVPDSSASQKSFKAAFILITSPNTFTGNELPGIENIRNGWAGRFAQLTGGKGTIADIPPSITITLASPTNGDTITGPDVTVKGAVINTTGNETGITVNGAVATVYGNQFIANHVPLTEGSNTLTVTAADTVGTTATTSITVNAVAGNYIRLTSNIESGISPLEVSLRIDGSFSIDNSSMNVTGSTQPEVLSSSPDEYKLKFNAEGTYYLTASAPGPDGNTYQDTLAITVMNKTQLDTLLKAKWEGMKGALADQDVSGAINFFLETSKDRYRTAFTAIIDDIPELIYRMQAIEMIYFWQNVAKYRVNRIHDLNGTLQTITYYIYFYKDADGVWKIDRF